MNSLGVDTSAFTGSPDSNMSMLDVHVGKLLWICSRGHARVREVTGLRLGRSEVLRSLRHSLRAQSQGHCTIALEERGAERAGISVANKTKIGHLRLFRPLCMKLGGGQSKEFVVTTGLTGDSHDWVPRTQKL